MMVAVMGNFLYLFSKLQFVYTVAMATIKSHEISYKKEILAKLAIHFLLLGGRGWMYEVCL